MIQIVQGTFGYWNGTSVVPKTSKDGPLELEPTLEQRLVEKGVAVYVNAEPQAPAAPPAPTGAEDSGNSDPANSVQGEPTGADDGLPEYNADMKLDELKEIAAAYDVDASKMRSKAEVVAAIDAAKAALQEETGDDEAPPVVTPVAPVV